MPPAPPLVHIITINWNGLADTLECLASLTVLDYPNYRVNVVDNGSTDGSATEIRRLFPQVIVTELPDNRGVSGGNNAGIRAAREAGAAYVLLVNNDTVLPADILRVFVAAAQAHPEAGVLGAKVVYYDRPDVIWSAGCVVDDAGRIQTPGEGAPADGPKWNDPRSCDSVCGCGLFAPMEVFDRAGLFDERYFLIWQDTDFCYRVRRAGYAVRYEPRARVLHKVSRSFVGGAGAAHQVYFYWRNRLLFLHTHRPWRQRLTTWRWGVLPDLRLELRLFLSRRTDPARRRRSRAALRGVADYFLGRFGNGPAWLFRRPALRDPNPQT